MRMTESEKKALRREYLESWPTCQYEPALEGKIGIVRHFKKEVELEHIFGRVGEGAEHWSNYATVSPGAHVTKHDHPTACRIAICRFKFGLAKESGDWRHFDLDAIRSVLGKHFPGWLEIKVTSGELPEWAEEMGRDLLERIESRG